MPDKTIIIYDKTTMLPKFTAEPPYPEEVLTFYENLVAEDTTIGMILSEDNNIHLKCIKEVGGELGLTDQPPMNLEAELTDNILTISNLQPNSYLVVDDDNEYELDESTTMSITLANHGTYKFFFRKAPYLDSVLEITYES